MKFTKIIKERFNQIKNKKIEMNFFWKNIVCLVFSAIVVWIFTFTFANYYEGIRPEHKVEVTNSVHVLVKNEKGKFVELDTAKYKVQPVIEEVKEKPLIDGTDYSSYLISFVSVLATFIVIANFANAAELSDAKETAKRAKEEAINAKKDLDEAYSKVKDLIKEIDSKSEKIDKQEKTIEESIKSQNANIESQSKKNEEYKSIILQKFEDYKKNIDEIIDNMFGKESQNEVDTQVSASVKEQNTPPVTSKKAQQMK